MQKPQEKINHGLVLGGAPGIGKDTMLEPLKYAVGAWNFQEVSPTQVMGRFTGHLKCVVLRISEAKDQGDIDRYKLYEHTKTLHAAPPDVLRVDEKHRREHNVFNVCFLILTTNYKTNGIYLPADDRRHHVASSEKTEADFTPGYWNTIWRWYEDGGLSHVAAWLEQRDISGFDPKAPPPKTAAFWAIVDANRAPEDAGLADALDKLKQPDVVTIDDLLAATIDQELRDRACEGEQQEPTSHPAPDGAVRLCPGAQRRRRERAFCRRGQAAGHLRQTHAKSRRSPQSCQKADQVRFLAVAVCGKGTGPAVDAVNALKNHY